MMRQSTNKKKIYFYLFIFLFISTIFNHTFVIKLNDLNIIKNIDIKGLSGKEEKNLRDELKVFENNNIFFIKKKEIVKILSIFNFLENFYIQKVLPSKLIVFAKKTTFLGMTIIDGKRYYIGSNGKLTRTNQVTKEQNLPLVFGKFSVSEFLNLQKILIKESFELNKIKKYFFHKSKRWDLQDDRGVMLMLPYKNIKRSLEVYGNLIDNSLLNSVKIIDLRISNNIVLTYE